MNAKSLYNSATLFMCCLLAPLLTAYASDAKPQTDTVITLSTPVVDQSEWKRAGDSSPQNVAETFLWALREQDFKTLKSCFNGATKDGGVDFQNDDLKSVAESAHGLQCLALRIVDGKTVDLKFRVSGWGDKPLSHRLKWTGKVWKFDSSSSTVDADW